MITVTQFLISSDRSKLSFKAQVNVGETITGLKLWHDGNYKTISLAKDLTSYLAGTSNTENIVFTNTQAGVSEFDGIYFAEITSSDVADPNGMVATFSPERFYATIAALMCNVDLSCLNCNANFQNALMIDLYVQGIVNSIRIGRFRDAIEHINKMNIITETVCSECCDIKAVVSTHNNIVSVGVIDCILNL